MDYSSELIIAILSNMEYINSFLERTTSELFPTHYEKDQGDFFNQEGNTLTDPSPSTTRIPKRDSLRENLIIMKSDVERALGHLELDQKLAVLLQYTMEKKSSSPLAEVGITKMVNYLNGIH